MALNGVAVGLALVCLTSAARADICMVEVTRRDTSLQSYSMTVQCERDISKCSAKRPSGFCVKTNDEPNVVERHCTIVKTCTPRT